MNLATLEQRIRTLERASSRQELDKARSALELGYGASSWDTELVELREAAKAIMEQAKAAGDLPTALAAIRVRCSILELSARLRGHLDERTPTNVVNVNLDVGSGRRIAEVYLARLKKQGEQ